MNSHSPDITCSQKINSFKYRFQIAKAIVKRAVSIIFRIFGKKVFTNQNSCGIISSAFKHMLMGACSSAGRAFGSHPRGREFESLQVHQMNEGRSIEQLNWTVQYFYPHSILKTLVLSGFFFISSWITKMDSQ